MLHLHIRIILKTKCFTFNQLSFIIVNIYDNLTAIASFRLYIHYDGIKNDDTTINYSVQKVSNKNIENELAQTTQTLKLNIGDTFTFETNNNYASVSTEYDCLYDNGIYYFNELGTYTLTITVTASDKVTTNTYTFIFKIVENEDIVTITLSNGKTISLKDSFTNLNFGSFAYTESNISGDTTTYELIKLYDLDYYNEIVSQNKTSLSFNLKKSGLTIYANTSNNIITSYNDVEFNLTQVGETYELIFGVKFAANIDKEIKNVVLNCKIIFKDVTRLATITTTNNSLTTNYVLGLSNNNELAGDFNATIIDDEFCYATSLTENSYTTTDEGSKLTVNITHNSIYTIVKNDTLNTKLDTTGNISLDIIEINEEKVAMFKVVSTSQYEEYLQGEISVLEGFLVVLKLK